MEAPIILDLLRETAQNSWIYFISAILINFIACFLLAFRYQILFKQINERISILNSFNALLIAAFSGYIVPFAASAIVTKPVAIKVLSKNPIKKSVFATVFENLFDLSWQVILLPFLLIGIGSEKLFNDLKIVVGISALFPILMILLFRNYGKAISWLWKFKKVLPKIIIRKGKEKKLTEKNAKKIMGTFIQYLSGRHFLIKILVPTLILILLLPFTLNLSVLIFSTSIPYRAAFVVHWISSIAGRLSGMPRGIGSKDITMIVLLTFFGFDAVLAVKITLLNRFISMVPHLLVGGPLLLYLGKIAPKELLQKR